MGRVSPEFLHCVSLEAMLRLPGVCLLMLFPTICLAVPKFALVSMGTGASKTEYALHGKLPKGTKVVLLAKNKEATCPASVVGSAVYGSELLEFDTSNIEYNGDCEPVEYFLAVITDKEVDYRPLKEVTLDGQELKNVSATIKKSALFSKHFTENKIPSIGKVKGGAVPAFTVADLKRAKPFGHRYRVGKTKILDIVNHATTDGYRTTWFGVYKDTVSAVSGTFGLEKRFVFLINEVVYVFSSHSCIMACGSLTDEVYEFRDRGFVRVYYNCDFSD